MKYRISKYLLLLVSIFTSLTASADVDSDDGHESATQAVLNMGPGWNLGNTLDSHGSWIGDHQSPDKYETMWGQPQADANLMRKLKEKGFGAIRVPVTWYQHMQADGSVDKDWMDRVQEVVDYVINAGMYCILNLHHDTGAHDVAWVVADASAYDAGKARYEKLWTEIATRFANYGDKLVFEAYNEMLDKSFSWTQPKSTSSYGVVTNWGESFVKAVRATGGNNQYRNLVISTYSAATSEQTLKNFKMPTDASQNHLIVEVHSYDPWNWVNTYNMTWTKECHQALVDMFGRLQNYIISKGWPVIVGEYGSNGDGEKTINASSTAAQKAEAGRQAADMSRLCRQYGAACFYWMGIIEGADRAERTFHWSMEQVADSIVKVYAPMTYTLSIQSGSGGSVSYDGMTITNTTKSLTVVEGASATISISPNSGYKLSKLTVNGTNVTSSVSDNQFTINNITANTSVVATFEQITDEPTPSVLVMLKSQSIAEGSEIEANTTSELQLTYSVAIKVSSSANITLNGTKVTATRMTNNVAGVQIPLSLEEGTDYTLIVPAGSIVASKDASASAPEFKLNFKTKAKAQPVNPDIKATLVNGNDAAQKLYDFMREQYGQKVISSVMANVNWNNEIAESVYKLTKKYPAAVCYDFIHICYSPANWIDYTNITPVKQWSDAGGIVQLMWHFNVPKAEGSTDVTCTPSETTFRVQNVFTSGSWENRWFYEQMDKVVATLLKLQDAGIAATWRPFHEAAGNATAKQQAAWTKSWFWWGYDGAETYKKLWTTMFNYFKEKGVKNLIWIWTTQNYNGNSATYNQDTDWYPGDAYVDIVGRDLYGYTAQQNLQEFTEIQATYPTKMIALAECGYGTYDNKRVDFANISDCWNTGARWSHFMVWYQAGQGSTNSMMTDGWWKDAMQCSDVITRDQLTTLSIQATGNGTVTYNSTSVTKTTKSFTVAEGTSATLTITPDAGYRLASLTVNGTNVTSSVSNGKYTVSNITANTSVVATFEQIPVTTYTLSIQSGSGGSVSYEGTAVTNTTKSFTVAEGSSAIVTITPNTGYKLSKLTVNGTNVTSSVKNNQYTISNITANTSVVATFEQVTYTLSVQATGNGTVTYNNTSVKNTTRTFTVNHGSSATLTITPDAGYRLSSLTVNGTNVSASVSNGTYTIGNITANTSGVATFEQIPVTTYTLSIQSGNGGSVSYEGTTVTNTTKSFTVVEGCSATISISPNSGYKLSKLTANGTNVTSSVKNNQYTISNITTNTSVVATFEQIHQTFSQEGINYEIELEKNHTLNVGSGEYSGHVVIPATVTHGDETWTVTGVADGAFDTPAITAITWNPPYAIGSGAFGNLTNPNLLLYVKDAAYAPENVQNVIANGRARKIVLTDAASGNDFDCPKAFTAEEISYTHRYSMTTGIGECRGWETIALPFTVQKVMHQTKGQLVTFKQWDQSSDAKPYWLYKLTYTGFVEADFIEANTPYVISMPNHEKYYVDYILAGDVTFSAQNATVKTSENMTIPTCNEKTFRPCFAKTAQSSVYAINAVNNWVTNTGGYKEGSVFVEGLRSLLPFEAYMTTNATNAKGIIPIFEMLPTAIREIPQTGYRGSSHTIIFNLSGQAVMITDEMSLERALSRLPHGVYIVNGKKVVIK